jgi:hypothetical protein
VAITGFAVGTAGFDDITNASSFSAGKVALSLFKPVGDAYLFATHDGARGWADGDRNRQPHSELDAAHRVPLDAGVRAVRRTHRI